MEEGTEKFVQHMMQVFTMRNAQGGAVFSGAEIRHFIPYLIMRLPIEAEDLPHEMTLMVADTMEQAGISAETSGEQSAQLMLEFYKSNPPSAALLTAFEDKLREWNVANVDTAQLIEKASNLIGATRSSGVLDSGERPAGTISAGPMARFNLTK